MDKSVGHLYRVCRPEADSSGTPTGKHSIFPAAEQKPYSAGEVYLALAEFNKFWKNIGVFPPRGLEPYAIPMNPDCAVIRISDIDPDFFLPPEPPILTTRIVDKQLYLISELEGASHVGTKPKKGTVGRYLGQRKPQQAAVSDQGRRNRSSDQKESQTVPRKGRK